MTMRLYVYILRGEDIPVKNAYVKVRVGKFESKTRKSAHCTNQVWNEEFAFRVHDLNEEVVLAVLHRDDVKGLFNGSGKLMGRVKIPLCSISAKNKQILPPTWFSIDKRKTGKFISKECGKVLIAMSMHEKMNDVGTNHFLSSHPNDSLVDSKELKDPLVFSRRRQLVKAFSSRLEKVFHKSEENSKSDNSSEISSTFSDYQDFSDENLHSSSFEEAMKILKSKQSEQEMPESLEGGILLDEVYMVSPKDLNTFLFSPDSQFQKDLATLRGTTCVHEKPWTWKSSAQLSRIVSYMNPATNLVKSVKATEEQMYVKASDQEFAIFVSVNTPDVPYGGTFKVELLYKIIPGLEVDSSNLIVSWGIDFHQKTMMKAFIEGGVRQGLKESFEQFESLLGRSFKVVDYNSSDISEKDHMLTSLEAEHQTVRELAICYFWNFTVISAFLMVIYVCLHIWLCEPSKVQGLEFSGFDLPDSFGQLITGGILILQLERIYNMVLHFIQARLQRGSDHGVKVKGDGWVLTVALIEGINLASIDSTGFPDPFVVFSCNGRTRTSSVELQARDPQWNEIFEFDAVEEPPSVLSVEAFYFDGSFDQATSIGHAEINFLKHSSAELADMWVSLEGKIAQSSQSKLHLRIFLDNNNGVETIKEYLTKMEKKVGKKFTLQSPHINSAFQKLFSLPPEEFLISDYSCCLKRKLPLQGRIYLSARIVGFYANLFGHKTKFFFVWEDIEDIQILTASLSSVIGNFLVVVLRKGRGLDASHGAKSQDEQGRLIYYFHSFTSFNVASRTIMALWRARTLAPEEKSRVAEEQQQEEEVVVTEDAELFLLEAEDAKCA